MEVEFRTSSRGEVFYEDEKGTVKRLTKFSTDIVEKVVSIIKERYPASYARLATLYETADPTERKYLMAERFISCNFGRTEPASQETSRMTSSILRKSNVLCEAGSVLPKESFVNPKASTS